MNIIRKMALAIVALFAFISASADSYYVVTADKLNVREGPGSEYGVQMSYQKGDIIICSDEVEGEWVRLKEGSEGYVNVNYLEYQEPVTSQKSDVKVNIPFLQKYVDKLPIIPETTVLIIIAALALLTLVLMFVYPSIVINSIMLILMTAMETYFLIISENPLWFCDHKLLGWLIAGLNTAGFAAVTGIQTMSYIMVIVSLAARKLPKPKAFLKPFFIMWPIALVLLFIGSGFNSDTLEILGYVVLGVQALYAIIAFIIEKDFISGPVLSIINLIGGFGLILMTILTLVCVFSALIRIVAILAGVLVIASIIFGILSGTKTKTNDDIIIIVRKK